MAFKINVDSNSYSSQAEKAADNYVLTIAKKLINDETGARESEDSSLSRRIDKNLDSIESLNEFRTAATEELSKKELLANKTEYISTAPSHEKYPTEQAVVEFVAGLGEENGGHVHLNKQAIDTIYEEDIQRWDRAAENVGDIALMPLAERVNTLIDDVDVAEVEIEKVQTDIQSLFENKNALSDEMGGLQANIKNMSSKLKDIIFTEASDSLYFGFDDFTVSCTSGTTEEQLPTVLKMLYSGTLRFKFSLDRLNAGVVFKIKKNDTAEYTAQLPSGSTAEHSYDMTITAGDTISFLMTSNCQMPGYPCEAYLKNFGMYCTLKFNVFESV